MGVGGVRMKGVSHEAALHIHGGRIPHAPGEGPARGWGLPMVTARVHRLPLIVTGPERESVEDAWGTRESLWRTRESPDTVPRFRGDDYRMQTETWSRAPPIHEDDLNPSE